MSVQFPDVVVVFNLGMLARSTLPDKWPSWASNPGAVPKDRFWPNSEVAECPLLSLLDGTTCRRR